jgi:heme A synthase
MLAALALTAWWSRSPVEAETRAPMSGRGPLALALVPAFALVLVLGTSGAVTALGDTLFPDHSHFAQNAPLLLRLGLVHPLLATITAIVVLLARGAVVWMRPDPAVRAVGRALSVALVVQYGAGLLNVELRAPVAMQLVHLLLADCVWILLVLFAASALGARAVQPSASRNGPAPTSDVPPSTSNVAPVTYAAAGDTR